MAIKADVWAAGIMALEVLGVDLPVTDIPSTLASLNAAPPLKEVSHRPGSFLVLALTFLAQRPSP